VSEAALRAVQNGLDSAAALAESAMRLDVSAYAQRDAAGVPSVGGRAELVRRLSKNVDVLGAGWLERSLTTDAKIAAGIQAALRVKW
jgi:hypothetical protein